MIDVSLLDNNLLEMNFQPVWIRHLLEIVQNDLEQPINDRVQNLVVLPFEGINAMIYGDGERLYQSIRNILMNAIKFTPDGGTITVDGRLLPGFIELMIADTGIGIDLEDQGGIFEKFGQVGNVRLHSSGKFKYKGKGPGLGLPIAKGIVEAHGGTVWVESQGYDEVICPGTIFHILLPISKGSPEGGVAEVSKPCEVATNNPMTMKDLLIKQNQIRSYQKES
jgi:signal transduction histidine kinase